MCLVIIQQDNDLARFKLSSVLDGCQEREREKEKTERAAIASIKCPPFFLGSNELISGNIRSTKKQQDKCAGIFSRLNDSLALVYAFAAKFICPCDSAQIINQRWMDNE